MQRVSGALDFANSQPKRFVKRKEEEEEGQRLFTTDPAALEEDRCHNRTERKHNSGDSAAQFTLSSPSQK